MRSMRFWMLVVVLMVVALAIRPAGEYLIRSEVARQTGSQLSMERCQVNMLTGTVAIDHAVIRSNGNAVSDDSSALPPIKIAKIWSRGSLNQFLYRKISAPITLMDGIEIESSDQDERQVPSVQPVTQLNRDSTLLLAPQRSPLLEELEQAFKRTRDAIIHSRQLYEQIDQQLKQIENRSASFDNPLRDRDALSDSQQRLAVLQRELEETRTSMDQNRDEFRQASLSIQNAASPNKGKTALNRSEMSEGELEDLKIQAQALAEHLVCSTVGKLKPYLGISATMTRRYLMEGSRSSRASSVACDRQGDSTRGTDYHFGMMNENEFSLGTIQLRGAALLDQHPFPFTGKMVNMGNQGLRANERPSMSLTFAAQDDKATESPEIVLKSLVIPDRQGFQIHGHMQPIGSMIASVAQGDWRLAAFGQNASVNLAWLVHQSEWSLVVDIRGSQSEIVVKRNALLSAPVQSDLMPRYESCFEAAESMSLAKAEFQGDIEDGVPRQRTFQFTSPFLDGLARSMAEQQRMILEIGNNTFQQNVQTAFAESTSRFQNEIESSHRELIAVHASLRKRLESSETKISEAMPERSELRFSRENTEGILR